MEFALPPYVINEIDAVLPMSQTTDWGLNLLNIRKVHELGFRGKGMIVAVLDTGTTTHADLNGAVVQTIDIVKETTAAFNGHGLMVDGIIAARDNERGILGIAPQCSIIHIKVMGENGSGKMIWIEEGLKEVIRLKPDVVNMSLGSSSYTPTIQKLIEEVFALGIHIICAAGNDGRENSVSYPAKFPQCVAVGAVNEAGRVSAFSSQGWEIDIAAPGEKILGLGPNDSYVRASGTSFAAPACSGIYALMKEAGVALNHELVKQTAIDIEQVGPDPLSGHGLINPLGILEGKKTTNLIKAIEAHRLLGEFLQQISKNT